MRLGRRLRPEFGLRVVCDTSVPRIPVRHFLAALRFKSLPQRFNRFRSTAKEARTRAGLEVIELDLVKTRTGDDDGFGAIRDGGGVDLAQVYGGGSRS